MPDDAYKSTPTVQEKFHLQSNTQEQLQGYRTFHLRIQRLLVDPMAICEKKMQSQILSSFEEFFASLMNNAMLT